MSRFIKLNDTPELKELLAHPKEFALLTQIAIRARRSESRFDGLKPGEALIGDYSNIGLSERNYRTAKKNLEKWKLSTFKGTNKGTVATLCNDLIYDINITTGVTDKMTGDRRTGDGRVTTNKNVKKEKKHIDPSYLEVSRYLVKRVQERKQIKVTPSLMEIWANVVRLMVEQDNRTVDDIYRMIDECHNMSPKNNGFTWANNILSMSTLRSKWNEGKISLGMNTYAKQSQGQTQL